MNNLAALVNKEGVFLFEESNILYFSLRGCCVLWAKPQNKWYGRTDKTIEVAYLNNPHGWIIYDGATELFLKSLVPSVWKGIVGLDLRAVLTKDKEFVQ